MLYNCANLQYRANLGVAIKNLTNCSSSFCAHAANKSSLQIVVVHSLIAIFKVHQRPDRLGLSDEGSIAICLNCSDQAANIMIESSFLWPPPPPTPPPTSDPHPQPTAPMAQPCFLCEGANTTWAFAKLPAYCKFLWKICLQNLAKLRELLQYRYNFFFHFSKHRWLASIFFSSMLCIRLEA